MEADRARYSANGETYTIDHARRYKKADRRLPFTCAKSTSRRPLVSGDFFRPADLTRLPRPPAALLATGVSTATGSSGPSASVGTQSNRRTHSSSGSVLYSCVGGGTAESVRLPVPVAERLRSFFGSAGALLGGGASKAATGCGVAVSWMTSRFSLSPVSSETEGTAINGSSASPEEMTLCRTSPDRRNCTAMRTGLHSGSLGSAKYRWIRFSLMCGVMMYLESEEGREEGGGLKGVRE